jgi:hypothetical protein
MGIKVARMQDSPRLTEVLKMLGPVFRPVATSEIAEARGIKQKSAAKLASQLVLGSPTYKSAPQGGFGLARKLAKHLWAITDTGQEFLGVEPSADRAYMEWVLVLADSVSGEKDDFALDVLKHVLWGHLAAGSREDNDWEPVALQIIGAICRSPFMTEGNPGKPVLDALCQATFSIKTVKAAWPALSIIGDTRELLEDLWAADQVLSRLIWAERHCKLVLKGVEERMEGDEQ